VDGSTGKFATNPERDTVTNFRWSFDGRKLAVIRGHSDDDVALLQRHEMRETETLQSGYE